MGALVFIHRQHRETRGSTLLMFYADVRTQHSTRMTLECWNVCRLAVYDLTRGYTALSTEHEEQARQLDLYRVAHATLVARLKLHEPSYEADLDTAEVTEV